MTNEKGFVKLWRKIKVDEEIWNTKEPYDKRSAFLYLIMEADWKTGIIPSRLTERFLAQTWHWAPAKVHRFIVFLKSVNKLVEVEARSEARMKQKVKQIKIYNWKTYQKERTKPETENEAESGAIRKEGKEVKKVKEVKDSLVELFNSTCPSLSKVVTLSQTRKNKIQTRLKEHPLEWWKSVFEKADGIKFENKKTGKDWRPTFDWLIENDNNAVKVIEGNYDKGSDPSWEEKYEKDDQI